MSPVAASIAQELCDAFDNFQDSVASWDNYDEARYSEIHAKAEALCKIDVEGGNLILAKLGSVIGNDAEVERWCRNLEYNHYKDTATHMRFHHYVNMGYATKGQNLLKSVIERRSDQDLLHLMHGVMAIGAFTAAKNALQDAEMRKEQLVSNDFVEKIKSTHHVVAELGIEDTHLAQMFDEAGAILRAAHRNWASYELSIIAIPRTAGGPALSVEWPVQVSPSEAARLTWELTDRLVEKDLDRPGFSLGFLGVKLQ